MISDALGAVNCCFLACETGAGALPQFTTDKPRIPRYDAGQQKEWAAYLASIRQEHKRKRRLMETLDRLESRPILEAGPLATP